MKITGANIALAACFGLANAFALTSADAQTTVRPQSFEKLEECFGPGEDLTYTVKYGFVKGGEGHFTVRDTVIDGKHVNHIVCAGKTTGVADVFFKVRDSYESFMDPKTQLSVLSKRNIREGRYTYHDVVSYDRANKAVDKTIQKRDKPAFSEKQEVPDRIMDIVGAFYHARNNAFTSSLTVGDTICYETFFSNEVFPLYIKYRGVETVSTKFGKVECLKFSPITEVGRSFKTEDDMHLWVTNDGNRLPVKIKFDLAVGSFVCELTDYSGLKHRLRTSR